MHSAWTSDARPSVAGTLTLKVFQIASKHSIFIKKLETFLGRGYSPRSHPSGRGIPLPHTPLSAPAYGASTPCPFPKS